jgi:molecular chaperone DnaK
VTFDLDANGILNVRAQDKGTGKEQKITITASSGLSKDEVEKMRREADAHAADDTRKKEEVEVKNVAEATVYSAEKTIREYGDKIPADLKTEVEGKIAAVRSALQGTDTTYIKNAMQALNESMQKIGAAVYQHTQPPPGGEAGSAGQGGGTPPPPKDEGTVEGEFREV